MEQRCPFAVAIPGRGVTGLFSDMGSLGQCTITLRQEAFDDQRIVQFRKIVQVLNWGYPVKRCKNEACDKLNIPIPGTAHGWSGRDPIRGDYCSEEHRWAQRQRRYRARVKVKLLIGSQVHGATGTANGPAGREAVNARAKIGFVYDHGVCRGRWR